MIQFENVNKRYGKIQILKNLNLTIPEGKFAVLIGPSGCGKTTTLKTINRLIEPDSGVIRIDGEDITRKDKVELRRHIGYVIQQIGLFPNMTVAQNIVVVPKLLKYDKQKCDEIVREMLKLVDMEQHAGKYPSELSGGQQQRIGVLRALAASPPIVLMDEPFGALDPMTRQGLQDEIKRIQQKLHKTIVFVTHDMDEALKLADMIIFMEAGTIVQIASPEEMLEHPATAMVSSFLGKYATANPATTKMRAFMKCPVMTAFVNDGVLQCAEMMARNRVDSLIITDHDGKYQGIITIRDLHHWGHNLKDISSLVQNTAKTAYTEEEAKESFDYLLSTNASYVVVLNDDDTVAGLVTKTSVARSVAEKLWGDME